MHDMYHFADEDGFFRMEIGMTFDASFEELG